MNHGKRKMYQGSILLTRKPKVFAEIIGACFLASMIVGLIMIGLAM